MSLGSAVAHKHARLYMLRVQHTVRSCDGVWEYSQLSELLQVTQVAGSQLGDVVPLEEPA